MPRLPRKPSYFVDRLLELQLSIRDATLRGRRRVGDGRMNTVEGVGSGDLVYKPDAWAHEALDEFCRRWSEELPFVLVAEGVGSGRIVLPEGTAEERAAFVLIVDPIDGTRGLMYDKRAAWVLSGVAAYRGEATNLRDIEVAMQTEIPTSRQYISAVIWAIRGAGAWGEQHNVLDGTVSRFLPSPAKDTTLSHGFATITKFFPRGKSLAAAIEERLMETLSAEIGEDFPMVFDDQYISSGGQLHELMVGHDLFTADLRPLLLAQAGVGSHLGALCAHPYDLCTEMVAQEAGVEVCDLAGEALSAPLDTSTNITWLGFANHDIRARVVPVLRGILADLGLAT